MPFACLDGLGRATCTVHLISTKISQEGTKCTKANKESTAYCPNKYTVNDRPLIDENGHDLMPNTLTEVAMQVWFSMITVVEFKGKLQGVDISSRPIIFFY